MDIIQTRPVLKKIKKKKPKPLSLSLTISLYLSSVLTVTLSLSALQSPPFLTVTLSLSALQSPPLLTVTLCLCLCLSLPFRSRTTTFIAAMKMTIKMVRPPTLLLLTATTMLSWQTTSSSTTISTIPTTLFHTATKWLSCNFVNWFPFGSIGFLFLFFRFRILSFFYWLFHNFVRFHLGLLEF